MAIRTSITGATWTQIGTGPATVELISVGTPVMVIASASAPATNTDGLLLVGQGNDHNFTETQPIWAQVVNPSATAVLAVQPETT